MTITSAPGAMSAMLQVDPPSDGRSWGILAGRRSAKTAVDRVASVEIAKNAIPTPAWTAHRSRRPQRPTNPFDYGQEKKRKMTSRTHQRRLTTIAAHVASLR